MRAAPKRRPEKAVDAEAAEAEEDVKDGFEESDMAVWWVRPDGAQEEDTEEDVEESGMVVRWTCLDQARCSWFKKLKYGLGWPLKRASGAEKRRPVQPCSSLIQMFIHRNHGCQPRCQKNEDLWYMYDGHAST